MIELSDSAREHLTNSLRHAPAGTEGVRLGLTKYGCSGYAYVFEFTDSISETDQVFAFDGLKVIIAAEYVANLAGSTLDYIKSGLNSCMKVINPNTVNACGCGESFQFKD